LAKSSVVRRSAHKKKMRRIGSDADIREGVAALTSAD